MRAGSRAALQASGGVVAQGVRRADGGEEGAFFAFDKGFSRAHVVLDL